MAIDIRRPLKKFIPHLIEARENNLNEADTVLRICRFFEDVLGYDGIQDISKEAQMKLKYVDVCLKIDGVIRLLVEAKAAPFQLRDRHIEQAERYASQNNYPWVILTNGIDWHLYHLTFDEGIEYERAFAVALDKEDDFANCVEKLTLLHKQSVKKGELEKFWKMATALGPSSIGKSLFTENVLRLLRRQIRADTKVLIDPEDLAQSIHDMLSCEAREQVGPLKIRRKRRSKKPKSDVGSVKATEPAAKSPAPKTTT